MSDLSLILQCGLAVVLVLLALLTAQLVVLGFLRLTRAVPYLRRPQLPDEVLPHVLVQLPVRNEGPLALRVAAAAARLDWPADKLHIQMLDDGNAEDHDALKCAVLAMLPAGIHFEILRRGERKGFKAGNLAFGLAHSDAPYVAVFDADFMPPADFLRRTVPALVADSGLCFVQARWGHANREANWLTRAQGMLLDAHFAVEQEARFRAGLPMSFNGTAGVWRRAAIDDVGGWSGDTLTEDLDLSIRCVLKGWRSAFVGDCVAPGELPETAAAWRSQQARWTKGHAQCAKKLLPVVWASGLPLPIKCAISLQMVQWMFYTLAFATTVIGLSLMSMGAANIQSIGTLGLGVTVFGFSSTIGYLWLGQKLLGRERMIGLHRSILLGIIFPSGLVLANTRATWDAFFSDQHHFTRTLRAGERYVGGWRGGPELIAGLIIPVLAFTESAWSAPFFACAVAGLLSIGGMGALPQSRSARRALPGK